MYYDKTIMFSDHGDFRSYLGELLVEEVPKKEY